MANRTPYNIAFCRFIVEGSEHCQYLKQNDMCKLQECIYNHKWIVYWETFDKYPPTLEE